MRRVSMQARTDWRHLLAAVTVAVLLAMPAYADGADPAPGSPGEREVTVLNHGVRPINEIYVSPQTAEEWGADRLGENSLESGSFIRLHLGWTRECRFDIKIIYDDASREERRDVDLCHTRQLAFDGSAATAAPGTGIAHSITLVNDSARPIQQVFISPAAANQWGDDRLAEGSISVAARRVVTWHGDCNADLRVVFDNRAAEERRGVDLCTLPALSIQPGWTTADALPVPPATAPAEATAANGAARPAAAPP